MAQGYIAQTLPKKPKSLTLFVTRKHNSEGLWYNLSA